MPPIGRIWYQKSAAYKTSKQDKPPSGTQTAHGSSASFASVGSLFCFEDPGLWTQIVDPYGLKKFLKIVSFFDLGIAGCCFVLPYPLESMPLWVSVWVRSLPHVFSASFPGKKINTSHHPYRMPSGIDGLFPGLKK